MISLLGLILCMFVILITTVILWRPLLLLVVSWWHFHFHWKNYCKILFTGSIVVVKVKGAVCVQFTQMAGFGTSALVRHVKCQNIPLISNSMLCMFTFSLGPLIHWGRVAHICISKLTITGSDNGSSPGQHQAIIWTSAGILLFEP